MRALIVGLVLCTGVFGQIAYPDFSNTAGLTINNHAAVVGNVMRVSAAARSQVGTVFSQTPVSVVGGFDMAFTFQITNPVSGGADGIALILQNDPRSVLAFGNHASAMGYGAFLNAAPGTAIANSLAIEFDTWNGNFNGTPDSSANEISVHTGGTGDNSQDEQFSIGRATPAVNMSDGQVHTARVLYVPGTLSVFLDDLSNPVLTVPYDFTTGSTYLLSGTPVGGLSLIGGTSLFAGFGASSGAASEHHDILSWYTAPYPFELNGDDASLTFDGQPDPGPFFPIVSSGFGSGTTNLELGTLLTGQPFDLAFHFGNAVPLGGGGFPTPGGQAVNVNLAAPTLGFLNGGTTIATTVPFAGTSLSLPIPYATPLTVSAQMLVFDPTQIDGFGLSHAGTLDVRDCGLSENFDALATGNNLPLGYSSSNTPWTVASGTTSSSATGPLAGAFSPSNYLYCETSGAGGTATFTFDTCNIDISRLATFNLDFRLSRIGATIGTLNIYQDDGTGAFATLLTSYTGAEPTGADWTPESIPFIPTAGNVAFRFEYTAGGSFTGDLAIDDLSIN